MSDNWKREKPSVPGAYWLKGNIWMHPEQTSLVRIEWFDGELCIVDAENAEDHSAYLSDWSNEFLWQGPLHCAQSVQVVDTDATGVCYNGVHMSPVVTSITQEELEALRESQAESRRRGLVDGLLVAIAEAEAAGHEDLAQQLFRLEKVESFMEVADEFDMTVLKRLGLIAAA